MTLLKRFAIPLIALVIFGLSIALAYTLKKDHGINLGSKIALYQRLGNKIPLDATFKDEYGETVTLGKYFGKKPVLMVLDYYSCQAACEVQFENLVQTFGDMKDKSIGNDFNVLSVSIDSRETPELARMKKSDVLASYTRPGARDGWHFLTGKQSQIKRLADAIGYKFYIDSAKNQILHPTGLFVLTPDGRLSRYFFGVDYVATMVSDSLAFAGQNKVNVPSDPILFGCLQFDPSTGRIGVDVYRALQITGCSLVVFIGFMIFFLVRTGPHNKKLTAKEDALGFHV